MALETPANDDFGPLALPLAWASLWSRAMSEAMTASIAAWSAIAESAMQAQDAFAAVWGAAVDVDRDEALKTANAADDALAAEIAASERSVERFTYVAEDALRHLAGRTVPLPD